MRRFTLTTLGLFVAFVLSFSFATAQTDEDMWRQFRGFDLMSSHVSFDFPPSIGDSFRVHNVLAEDGEPEAVIVNFEVFNEENFMWESTGGAAFIYPTMTFDDARPSYSRTQAELTNLLAERPASVPLDSPLLPLPDSPQAFTAQTDYLRFNDGDGVRYVVMATFGADPVTNNMLFYTYQGLTDDGAYYVALFLPVAVDFLPDVADLNDPFYTLDAEGIETYYNDVAAQLDATPADAFYPTLTDLDRMATSITITPPLQTTIPPESGPATLSYEGISFDFDASLASRVQVTRTEATFEQGMLGPTPSSTNIGFVGYPARENTSWTPQIRVLPIAEYTPDTFYDTVRQELVDLLVQRPALVGGNQMMVEQAGRGIPNGLVINAAQVFAIQPQYIDFANGRGVRFITYYAQGIDIITNSQLFYSFGGITDDGQYLITAVFPVNVPFLGDEPPNYDEIDEDFFETYELYLEEIIAQGEALAADQFAPNLSVLDALINSLRVE